ncbi:hypothetical protein [Caballeronia sp. INDeC2]|uniref:hypothetical protein n=1 Tax=Caballeronia sp. INDeC2 TaxID=2921747 RepID=UPI002028F62F|nr:hypothetical protein [Caballeronia sp. INDeC2]
MPIPVTPDAATREEVGSGSSPPSKAGSGAKSRSDEFVMDRMMSSHTSDSLQITCPTLTVDKFARRRPFIIDKIETHIDAELRYLLTTDKMMRRRGSMQPGASKETCGPDDALRAAGRRRS